MNPVRVVQAAMDAPNPDPGDVSAVSAALNKLATDLYQEISTENAHDSNVLLSPASIQQMLVLLLAASDGKTHQQLMDVLHLDLPDERLYPAVAALWKQLTAAGFKFDSSSWGVVRDTIALNPAYVSLVGEHLGATFSNDSFADPSALADRINSEVAEKTHAMIKELVTPDMLSDPSLFLLLVNAVYFKGDWEVPFSGGWDSEFTNWDGKAVTVPMMSRDAVSTFTHGEGFTAVELAYVGGASMLLVLPDKGRFDEVSAALDSTKLATIRADIAKSANQMGAELIMPKFEFAAKDPTDLAPALTVLGAPRAFDVTSDWAPLLYPAGKDAGLGFMLHKAAIKVDELGTEAAAATVGGMVGAAAPQESAPPITIDRPFIVTIQDTETGTTLFIGRIGDPQ